MTRHRDSEARNDPNLKLGWKSGIHLWDDYAEYCDQFLNTLSEFPSTRNGRISRVTIAKHDIDLMSKKHQPLHTASYREGQKTPNILETETDKLLLQKFIA